MTNGGLGFDAKTDPVSALAGCGDAEVKLKDGPPPGVKAPPNDGVGLLAWPPNNEPPAGVDEAPLAPPNWKEVDPPVPGAEAPPKLKRLPGADVDAAPALLPPTPDAKGLLNAVPVEAVAAAPPEPNWKLKPPDPVFAVEEVPPKLIEPVALPVGAGVDEPPNIPPGAAVVPKFSLGAEEPPLLPPLNALFAGDGSSCFMGLPLKREPVGAVIEGGDFGAPNSDIGAGCAGAAGLSPVLEELPKLKVGAGGCCLAVGAGVEERVGVAAAELLPEPSPPKSGFNGAAPLPNKPGALPPLAPKRELGLSVAAALIASEPEPNNPPAGVLPELAFSSDFGAETFPNRVGALPLGLAPNKVLVVSAPRVFGVPAPVPNSP